MANVSPVTLFFWGYVGIWFRPIAMRTKALRARPGTAHSLLVWQRFVVFHYEPAESLLAYSTLGSATLVYVPLLRIVCRRCLRG